MLSASSHTSSHETLVTTLALHALHLVLADDHVLERGTGFHDEHGRILAGLLVAVERGIRMLVRLHLVVKHFTSPYRLGLRVLGGS